MKTSVVIVSLALAVSCFAQTADELIVKNLAARGGPDKLRAIRTIAMTGTISFGDASSPLTVKAGRPNQIREDFAIDGTSITRAYDGKSGWEKKGEQARSLEAGELNNIREEAENAIEGPLLDYAAKGSKAEALGKVDLNGKPAYKLKITTGLGTSITQFLDATTYLEIHEEIERSANGSVVTIVEDVGDYRDVNGVKFAHRFVSGTRENPAASTLQIEKMQLNVPIQPSLFDKPGK
ncbi:MAG TPA: hypothetical protein VNW47_05025 [Terriglobales bacterium]|jgi:hypothetical protein|nr:hypothetical protein [Terriglobales bacterium]